MTGCRKDTVILWFGGLARFLTVVFGEFFGHQKIFAFFWSLARFIGYNQPSPSPAAVNSWRGEPLLPHESMHFIGFAFAAKALNLHRAAIAD